ncbi:MAG: amidohydrolase family protein, partial [Candidatus Binatia bacterium]
AEAQRCARIGLASVSIPQLVTNRPYDLPEWDPLWAALQELGLPVAIHVGTGKAMHEVYSRMRHIGGFMLELHCMAHTFADLIWGGVAQRYPKLRFVSVEAGIGWIAAQFQPWDRMWSDHYTWLQPKLDEPPSFYFKRQFWATFERDRAGILTRELLNVDHLLWGSDYPHLEGTFPQSQEMVAKVFAGVPEAETRKMVRDNAAALYNLAV